jgi:outer membrane biogenesis lipoprotein LolB
LRDHQGQEFEADSASQVLADGTGWHIPLMSWATGFGGYPLQVRSGR